MRKGVRRGLQKGGLSATEKSHSATHAHTVQHMHTAAHPRHQDLRSGCERDDAPGALDSGHRHGRAGYRHGRGTGIAGQDTGMAEAQARQRHRHGRGTGMAEQGLRCSDKQGWESLITWSSSSCLPARIPSLCAFTARVTRASLLLSRLPTLQGLAFFGIPLPYQQRNSKWQLAIVPLCVWQHPCRHPRHLHSQQH